jgi:hypothetical protein
LCHLLNFKIWWVFLPEIWKGEVEGVQSFPSARLKG